LSLTGSLSVVLSRFGFLSVVFSSAFSPGSLSIFGSLSEVLSPDLSEAGSFSPSSFPGEVFARALGMAMRLKLGGA